MRSLAVTVLTLSVLTSWGEDAPKSNLREEPPVLSSGLVAALQWLAPKSSVGWADDWITKTKKQKADVVARVLYFDSHTTTYRVVILKDGSAYSWREVRNWAYQNSFEHQFSKEELKGLFKAFSDARLANLDGVVSAGKDAVLLSLESEPLSPFVIPVTELPASVRGKLAKLLRLPDEDAEREEKAK